jgi:hypothetical protein
MIQRPTSNMATLTRSTVAQRFNASGALEAIAADVIREDYDPVTLAGRGMLVEPSITELVTVSAVTGAEWQVLNAASVSYLTLGALGVFPGALVTSGGATADVLGRMAANDIALTSGLPYAWSIYYRAGTSGRLRVQLADVAGGTQVTATGLVGALAVSVGTAGALTIDSDELLADGLTRRLRMTFTPSASASFRMRAGPDSATAGQNVTLLAAFLRQSSAHSSPIMTTGATLLRAADFPSVALGPWFSDTAGTGVIAFIPSAPIEDGQRVLSIDTGVVASRLDLRTLSGALRFTAVNGGVSVLDIAGGTILPGVVNRVAFAFQDGDCAISLNGGASVTSAATGLPVGFTRFLPGRLNTTNHLNGWISSVVWWRERKLNSYLEAQSA